MWCFFPVLFVSNFMIVDIVITPYLEAFFWQCIKYFLWMYPRINTFEYNCYCTLAFQVIYGELFISLGQVINYLLIFVYFLYLDLVSWMFPFWWVTLKSLLHIVLNLYSFITGLSGILLGGKCLRFSFLGNHCSSWIVI